MSSHNIDWRFIPARAAWFGGMYERLIGLTKNCLKKVMENSLVTLDELQSLIVETECRINNRPLTYVSNEMNDPIPLTPSQLLYGYRIDTMPCVKEDLGLSEWQVENPMN